jgi:hypothetical protein
MEIQSPNPKMMELSVALCKLRDSFTKMSLMLSDHISDLQCPERDELAKVVEMRLAQIFLSDPRSH